MANPSVNKVPVNNTKIFQLSANVEKTLVFPKAINLINITNMTTNNIYFRNDDEIAVVNDPECYVLNSELLSVNRITTGNYDEISFISDVDSTIQIFNQRRINEKRRG